MSRVGKKPIEIPKEVKVQVANGTVSVQGPKGKLQHELPAGISIALENDVLLVSRSSDERQHRSLHGLTRALIANMMEGVSSGFAKELEITGVGYRAEKSGKTLTLSLGFSHPVVFEEPDGVQIQVEKQLIKVEGIDKCLVGQTAAKIRKFRKPDPYKGKGIRYVGEHVRRKVGKAGASK
ncbi:50S ribosomal protein L6 [Thermodesulfobacteriota bacterium]